MSVLLSLCMLRNGKLREDHLMQVMPDAANAQRSMTTGHLIVTMPKEDPNAGNVDLACVRYAPVSSGLNVLSMNQSTRDELSGYYFLCVLILCCSREHSYWNIVSCWSIPSFLVLRRSVPSDVFLFHARSAPGTTARLWNKHSETTDKSSPVCIASTRKLKQVRIWDLRNLNHFQLIEKLYGINQQLL